MIIEILFVFSILFNILLVLYSKHLLAQLKEISLDLMGLRDIMSSYVNNLRVVYESEMFYGEPILENLVNHSKDVASEIEEIFNQYDFEEVEKSLTDPSEESREVE